MAKIEDVLIHVRKTFPYVKYRYSGLIPEQWEFWLDHYEAILSKQEILRWSHPLPEDEPLIPVRHERLHISSGIVNVMAARLMFADSSEKLAREIVGRLSKSYKVVKA